VVPEAFWPVGKVWLPQSPDRPADQPGRPSSLRRVFQLQVIVSPFVALTVGVCSDPYGVWGNPALSPLRYICPGVPQDDAKTARATIVYEVPFVRVPNVLLACQFRTPGIEYSRLTLLQPELFVVLAVATNVLLLDATLLITGASGGPTATTIGDGALASEKLRFLSVLMATTVKLAA